jgi:hypothetical protein
MGVTWDDVRRAVNTLARERGEWAGLPIPVRGVRLALEKRHPYPQLNGVGLGLPEEEAPAEAEGRVRNSWFSLHHNGTVHVCENAQGRAYAVVVHDGLPNERLRLAFHTLGVAASAAWSVGAELRAQEKLAGLIGPHKFQQYACAGMFLETSPRSGVTYLFRRLRPTLALRADSTSDGLRILAALCLHPIGYYEGSWAGVMVPTDCVIAHLMLMRGDERTYWAKANQHPAWRPQAGL